MEKISDLASLLDNTEQNEFEKIKFKIEHRINRAKQEEINERINSKEKTEFVPNHIVDLLQIREKPKKFLEMIYTGDQKVNKGVEKENFARDVFTFTNEILFSAEMENDHIGGIKESTMTPGKRALFALRLELEESEDTWPLLIDQPEDDLDSRSIYDEIVPFLKTKKKERQIIMVSHNANLVIGSDSESIIVANRNGTDRCNFDGKEFNYLSGSIENTEPVNKTSTDTLLSKGIRDHVCEILEGGQKAFEDRMKKLNFAKN